MNCRKKYDAMYRAFTTTDDARKEWHECYMRSREGQNELQKQIDEALEKCCTGIRKQGGNYYLELIEGILKGE